MLTKPATDDYRERYGVIVLCRDPDHQEHVYTQLRELGMRCRVVTV